MNDDNSSLMPSVGGAFDGVPLKELQTVGIATVKNIINRSVSKFCEIDPLPTWLLKGCILHNYTCDYIHYKYVYR